MRSRLNEGRFLFGALALVLAIALPLPMGCFPAGDDDPLQNNSQPDGGAQALCGPDNCAGCCDGNGECVAGDSELRCGEGGGSCITCGGALRCEAGACASTPPSCSPDTCNGCCDGDVCESGVSPTACGGSGFLCEVCGTTETCEGGFCVERCGPSNCGGCCDVNGSCVDGSADYACGLGGLDCAPCGVDEACSLGECIDASCQSTCNGCCSGDVCLGGTQDQACGISGDACTSCGPGRSCTGNACLVDPASRWDVLLVSADVNLLDANGDPWDAWGGLPDPFVSFTAGGANEPETTMDSAVQDNTISPLWDTVVLSDVSAAVLLDRFCYQVYDADIDSDDVITSLCFLLNDWDFDGSLMTVVDTQSTIRFRLELR